MGAEILGFRLALFAVLPQLVVTPKIGAAKLMSPHGHDAGLVRKHSVFIP